jgi:hypothetical protein
MPTWTDGDDAPQGPPIGFNKSLRLCDGVDLHDAKLVE